jgi:hypothetical protein
MIVPQLAIIAAMLSVAFFPSFYVSAINFIIKDFTNGLAVRPSFSIDFADTLKSIMVFSFAVLPRYLQYGVLGKWLPKINHFSR